MRKAILTAAVTGLVAASGAGTVLAQDEEQDNPTMRVVETWTCNYRDGKGPADLEKVNKEWNAWMDETGQTDYVAVTVTPNFFAEWAFDVGWIGVARDGHAFGKGADLWLTEGSEIGQKYGEVLMCDSHSAYVSMNVDPPEHNDHDDASDNTFVLSFSNCSIRDDHSFDDYMAANEAWNAYAAEHGFDSVGWVWFPIAGEADDSYDFKFAQANDDYTTMGANWQKFMDGHWRKSEELFAKILKCDSERIYDATMVRDWEDED